MSEKELLVNKLVTELKDSPMYKTIFSNEIKGEKLTIASKIELGDHLFDLKYEGLDTVKELESMATERLCMEALVRSLRHIREVKSVEKMTTRDFAERVTNCGDKQVLLSAEACAAIQDIGGFMYKKEQKVYFLGCHDEGTWFGKPLYVCPYLPHTTVYILPKDFVSFSIEPLVDGDITKFIINAEVNVEESEVFHITNIYDLKTKINFTN